MLREQRLDELIALQTQSAAPSTIDPISLIGHDVLIQAETLTAPFQGESPPLSAEIEAGTNFVLVEAIDSLGESVGVAVIGNAQDGSELRQGAHGFRLIDGGMRVTLPGGDVQDLVFEQFETDEDGHLVVSDTLAQPFAAGQTYQFQVLGHSNGVSQAVATNLFGTVDAVEIRNGQPVLMILGQVVDPTRIVRIQ